MESTDSSERRRPLRQVCLVLSGGGARAGYQAGVLQYIGELAPEFKVPLISGVSAGAINAAFLASYPGLSQAPRLVQHWLELDEHQVFKPESMLSLVRRFRRRRREPTTDDASDALLDSSPLREFLAARLPCEDGVLTAIGENIAKGDLAAACVTTTRFSTGQTVSWVQGRGLEGWERPTRVGIQTELSLNHFLASTALPLIFPAIRIGSDWYGDGGIRQRAPLAPAVHLGATDIIVISTRKRRSRDEAATPVTIGYPPAAQIIGMLVNAIFLDTLHHDVEILERTNYLIRHVPPESRVGLREIGCLCIEPSVDLGKLASQYELRARGAVRLFTQGLGTGETKSPDWLSMLLFNPDYLGAVIEIGWKDARRNRDNIESFLEETS